MLGPTTTSSRKCGRAVAMVDAPPARLCMALAYAGTQTSRISLGVAVVPTWPRHPQVLAQQAATANAMMYLCGSPVSGDRRGGTL